MLHIRPGACACVAHDIRAMRRDASSRSGAPVPWGHDAVCQGSTPAPRPFAPQDLDAEKAKITGRLDQAKSSLRHPPIGGPSPPRPPADRAALLQTQLHLEAQKRQLLDCTAQLEKAQAELSVKEEEVGQLEKDLAAAQGQIKVWQSDAGAAVHRGLLGGGAMGTALGGGGGVAQHPCECWPVREACCVTGGYASWHSGPGGRVRCLAHRVQQRGEGGYC